jgi:hypothetical protein
MYRLDENGDGSVSMDEWIALWATIDGPLLKNSRSPASNRTLRSWNRRLTHLSAKAARGIQHEHRDSAATVVSADASTSTAHPRLGVNGSSAPTPPPTPPLFGAHRVAPESSGAGGEGGGGGTESCSPLSVSSAVLPDCSPRSLGDSSPEDANGAASANAEMPRLESCGEGLGAEHAGSESGSAGFLRVVL